MPKLEFVMAKKKDNEKQTVTENGHAKNGEEPCFDDPPGYVDNISEEGKFYMIIVNHFSIYLCTFGVFYYCIHYMLY